MLYFNREEAQMLTHTAEVMGDRVSVDLGYTPENDLTLDRIGQIGNAMKRSQSGALVITGEDISHRDAALVFAAVVQAELNHWIPNASQRLIHRAGHALGVRHPVMLSDNKDCGSEPGWHALIADWVAGIYVRRCVTCCRLYADGTPE
jgi:hypothetical protein